MRQEGSQMIHTFQNMLQKQQQMIEQLTRNFTQILNVVASLPAQIKIANRATILQHSVERLEDRIHALEDELDRGDLTEQATLRKQERLQHYRDRLAQERLETVHVRSQSDALETSFNQGIMTITGTQVTCPSSCSHVFNSNPPVNRKDGSTDIVVAQPVPQHAPMNAVDAPNMVATTQDAVQPNAAVSHALDDADAEMNRTE
ncbi:hypothetical protein K474DRAFT_1712783 [Panus rudis PR-1116 ss-1]|nr:hypothetical protein K474DRAFT_1712783 [Panus rudis PR-1116 ss-1]